MTAAVRVVVVSWNTRNLLERCLESMSAHARRGQVEVVVVDNASTDGSAQLVEQRFGWATLIESDRNLGFGSAVNSGASGADTEWIAPANADIELTGDSIQRLIEVGRPDPSVGVVAPRLVLGDETTQDSVYAFPRLWTTLVTTLGLHRASSALAKRIRYGRTQRVAQGERIEWAMGAFLLVRRSAFEAVGGFDPEQWMYAEDLDLCWRLRRVGWTAVYVPDAIVKHAAGAATTAAFGKPAGTPHVVRAYYGWWRRRRGRAITALMAVSVILGASSRVIAYGLFGLLGVPGAKSARRRASVWLRLNVEAWRDSGISGAR